jgi:CRISPR type III-B/RAMP module-associated protein Cmr3
MIGVLLRPIDWVAFGPPRPSSAGETYHRATELPTPTAFQGVLRTALLAAAGDDFSDRSPAAQRDRDALVGGPGALPPGWQLRGPFFTYVVQGDRGVVAEPWLPAPRYLLRASSGPVFARLLRSPPVENGPAALNDASSGAEPLLLADPALNAVEPLGGWLSPRGLRWALSREADRGPWRGGDHCARTLPPFVKRQQLAGIEVDVETGTAKDGMLFSAGVLRFRTSSGLAGWLSASLPPGIPADALARGDLATCGWRSRPVVLDALPPIDPDFEHVIQGGHLPGDATEAQGFFLVALTPAPCAVGQSSIDAVERSITGYSRWPAAVEVRVLASMTGVPHVIGGLETVSRRPRPNRSYWEAGSAWIFVLRGGTPATRAEALRVLNDAHILGGKEASFGYGHTLVGVGPEVNADILQAAWSRKENRS